jgi:methyl coenzyme M reductase subunit C-like uncharacterized protein (methanogenesis marker protein 7)
VKYTFLGLATTVSVIFTSGCVPVVLAPGAEQVKITQKPTDVAGCTAVGNVSPNLQKQEDARNLTVGLGGNALLVTQESLDKVIISGVAYHCT